MAVISVEPLYPWQGRLQERRNRGYERVYRVETDTKDDGPERILSSGTLPAQYSPYVSIENDLDANALCKTIDIKQESLKGDSPTTWLATVRWDTRFDFNPSDWPENPLARPTRYDSGILLIEEFPIKDLEGNAYTTSIGERLQNRNPRMRPIPWIRATKNVGSQDWTFLTSHGYTMNVGTYLGFPRGSVLVNDIGYSQENWENNTVFYTLTVELHIEKQVDLNIVDPVAKTAAVETVEGWWEKVLHAGFETAIVGGSGDTNRRRIKDGETRDNSIAAPLDAAGNVLDDPDQSDLTYLKFREIEYADLTLLPI